MNSNLKLLSAGLLVAALAGCGGSSSDDMPPPPPPPPTPAEECEDAGNNWYEGACYTDQELIDMGVAQGRQDLADEQKADAMEEMAKKLRGLLAVEDTSNAQLVMARSSAPDAAVASANVVTALGKARDADNGKGMQGMAHVMVYDNKGAGIKVDTAVPVFAVGTNVAVDNNVMGADFATSTTEVKKHDNGSVVRGSYQGAAGGYACGGTDCTSQRTKDGIRLAGTWTWDPDEGQKYDVPDANYAEYGWWIDESIASSTATPNDQVGAWYRVIEQTAVALSATDSVTGTATYNGQAVGKAAYHQRQSDSNIGGAFTADATLSADFDANMLSGSITGFEVGGMNPDWSVELMKQGIDGTGIATSGANMTKWTINGTAGDAVGTWTATFYGIPAGEHQPSGVAGGFQSQYESDGYMVGAFGAER